MLGVIHEHFHDIKRKFNKIYFRVKDNREAKGNIIDHVQKKKQPENNDNDVKTHYYKFKISFYISRDDTEQQALITNVQAKKVMVLF